MVSNLSQRALDRKVVLRNALSFFVPVSLFCSQMIICKYECEVVVCGKMKGLGAQGVLVLGLMTKVGRCCQAVAMPSGWFLGIVECWA